MAHIFETTAGDKIEYGPIALDDLRLGQNTVIKAYRERGEPVDPPKYEVEVLGGEKEYHPHTEETIKDASDEEKAAWVAHQECNERMQKDIQDKTALIFLEAFKVKLPEDDNWIKRRKKLFDEDIPEDEEQQLLFYVNNVLLKTPADKTGLMEAVFDLSMSGTPKEVKEAYKDLFRSSMEEQGRAGAKLIKAIQRQDKKLVLQPVDAIRYGRQRVGNAALEVSEVADEG